MSSEVDKLKRQGNTLFANKSWKKASEKYTQALALDPKSSVLYSNRSACKLQSGRYQEAKADAKKATELDPSYAKAWARLAAAYDALREYRESVVAWQKAIDCLPPENLSSMQASQRSQYQADLAAAQADFKRQKKIEEAVPAMLPPADADMAWDIAERKVPELRAAGILFSSAFKIDAANKKYLQGVEIMERVASTLEKRSDGALIVQDDDPLGAVSAFAEVVVTDFRAFRLDREFLSMWGTQANLEGAAVDAWSLLEGPAHIADGFTARVAEQGWESARQALDMTVHLAIIRAIIAGGILREGAEAVNFYRLAIDAVVQVRRDHPDAPALQEHGAVTTRAFLRGMRNMFIDSYMQALRANEGPVSFEGLRREAQILLDEMDDDPDLPCDTPADEPGTHLALNVYPRATAHAMLGFVAAHDGQQRRKNGAAAAAKHFRDAAAHYVTASRLLPEDEEWRMPFLDGAFGHMISGGAPARDALGVVEDIRRSLPKVQAAWPSSSLSLQHRDRDAERLLECGRKLQERLDRGHITLDDSVSFLSKWF